MALGCGNRSIHGKASLATDLFPIRKPRVTSCIFFSSNPPLSWLFPRPLCAMTTSTGPEPHRPYVISTIASDQGQKPRGLIMLLFTFDGNGRHIMHTGAKLRAHCWADPRISPHLTDQGWPACLLPVISGVLDVYIDPEEKLDTRPTRRSL